jgi:Ca2+-binding RTX toxin-like protein
MRSKKAAVDRTKSFKKNELRRRLLGFEPLEDRRLLAFSVSLSGNAITFNGNASDEVLTLGVAANGLLQHDIAIGGNLVSTTDMNSTQVGEQSIAASSVASLIVNAGGGNDTVDGSALGFGITVFGGAGNDTILGGAGNDDLRGDAGDDIIEGNAGNDTLRGDSHIGSFSTGDDTLRGGAGNDTLYGDDSFYGGSGNDIVQGGSEADTLIDWISGLAILTDTNYTVNGTVSLGHEIEQFTIYGVTTNDTIDASAWAGVGLTIYGGAGNDTILGGAGNDDLRGDAGDDIIEGNAGNDTLRGDSHIGSFSTGNDTLRGGAGNDTLYGDDSFYGGSGNDSLDGGDGDDGLAGYDGNDTFNGGAGTDGFQDNVATDATLTDSDYTANGVTSVGHGLEAGTLYGSAAANRIDASAWTKGGIAIYGGAGNDLIFGGSGNDDLRGDAGDDTLEGNGGNDTLRGDSEWGGYSTGNDTLRGGQGNDTLFGDDNAQGGSGNDILDGGDGSNSIAGFGGSNTLIITGTSNADTLAVAATSYTLNTLVSNYSGIQSIRFNSNGSDDQVTTAAGLAVPVLVSGLRPIVQASRNELRIQGSFTDPGDNQTWTGEIDLGDGQPVRPLTINADKSFAFDLSSEPVGDIVVRIRDNEGNIGTATVVGPPRVEEFSRVGGVTGPVTALSVRFSRSMLAPSFTPGDIVVTGPGGPVIVSTVDAVTDTTFLATFAVPLQANGTYSVSVGPSITDLGGTPMASAFSSSFTQNLTGPRVTSAVPIVPFAGAIDGFQLNFSKPMDAVTFTESVITVSGPNSSIGVTQIFVSGSTATITIPRQTAPGGYLLTLQPTVRDALGIQLDQNSDGRPGLSSDVYTFAAANSISLSIQFTSSETTEGASLTGTVSRIGSLSGSLVVQLTSSVPGQLQVPTSVVIPEGQASANFILTPVNDDVPEKPELITISAVAPQYQPISGSVNVLDDDVPTLTMTVTPAQFSESAGSNAARVVVTRDKVNSSSLTVRLTSSDTTEITVPGSVFIAPNQASVEFFVNAIDDLLLDGAQTVTLTARGVFPSCGCIITSGAGIATVVVNDNEALTVNVSVDKDLIAEGGTAMGTVTRNSPTDVPLEVTLSVSDALQVLVPASVIIPAGQTSATFTVSGLDDNVADGRKTVIVTASAPLHASTSTSIFVTDVNVPDLIVASVELPANALTNDYVNISYRVVNQGLSPAVGTWIDRVVLSANSVLGDADDVLVGEYSITANVLVGQSYGRSVPVRLPNVPGSYIAFVTNDVGGTLDEGVEDNNAQQSSPLPVQPAYTAIVETDTTVAPSGTSILFRGVALQTGNSAPAQFQTVSIHIGVRGTTRTIAAITDSAGRFTATWRPIPGEAGIYTVSATHPAMLPLTTPQDTFTLVGLRATANATDVRVLNGGKSSIPISLQNLGQTSLVGLRMDVLSAPVGVTLTSTLPETIPADTTDSFELTLSASEGLGRQGTAKVRFTSADGTSSEVTLNVTVAQREAKLVVDPAALKAGMVVGQQTIVEFTVTNEGSAESGPVEVRLPQLAWLSSATSTLSSLAPSELRKVTLQLRPLADMALGEYSGWLVLAGTNANTRLDFVFRATSEAKGDLRLFASDESTYFAANRPRLSQTKVEIVAATGDLKLDFTTDANGEIPDLRLPVNDYQIIASKDGHRSFSTTVRITPATTTTVEVFLQKQSVTYSWSAKPILETSKNQIVLQSTFETNVPAPVLTMELSESNLDNLTFTNGTATTFATISNHGLIALHNITVGFRENTFYEVIPLVTSIDTLPAKSHVQVPVKITERTVSQQLSETPVRNISAAAPPVYSVPPSENELVPLPNPPPNSNLTAPDQSPTTLVSCGGASRMLTIGTLKDILVTPEEDRSIPPYARSGLQTTARFDISDEAKTAGFSCDVRFINVITYNTTVPPPTFPDITYKGTRATDPFVEPPSGGYDQMSDTNPDKDSLPWFTSDATAKPNNRAGFCRAGVCQPAEFYDPPFQISKEAATRFPRSNQFIRFRTYAVVNADCLESNFGPNVFVPLAGFSWGYGWDAAGHFRVEVPQSFLASDADTALINSSLGNGGFGPTMFSFGWQALPPTTDISKCFNFEKIIQGYSTGKYDCGTLKLEQTAIAAIATRTQCSDSDSCGKNPDFDGQAAEPSASSSGTAWRETIAPSCSLNDGALSNQIISFSDSGVCAKIRIRVDQDLVESHEVIVASLEIANNDNSSSLEEIAVDLNVYDSDGTDATQLFSITQSLIGGISSVDGQGILAANSIARIEWRIVPINPDLITQPKRFALGGTLSYVFSEGPVRIGFLPVPITVLPPPILDITYFHQRDVFSDDPFTEVIEPAEPYILAAMIRNSGKGEAKNVSITSAQPKIIENEKGLLADFQIIATEVEGQNLSPSLTANFGTITPDQTSVGKWLMTSTIQGLFIDYQATVTHVDAIGDKKTSTLGDVAIRELIHVVRKTESNGSSKSAFLTNDIDVAGDPFDLPDTLYVTDNSVSSVGHATNITSDGSVTAVDRIVNLTAAVSSGWNYLRVTDPGNGQYRLARVVRSDGVELPIENFWQTDRTFIGQGQRPIRENILHMADLDSTGSYTLYYEPKDLTPPVLHAVTGPVDQAVSAPVDSIEVSFSRAIDPNTFTSIDMELTRNGAIVEVPNSIQVSDLGNRNYRITGLASATTGDGAYRLTVRAAGVSDPFGVIGFGTRSIDWEMAGTAPAPSSTDLPAIRNTPVESIRVTFTRPVNLTTMTAEDIFLTRDGNVVALPVGVGFTLESPTLVRIEGLAAVTDDDGVYTIVLDGTGVKGTDGSTGRGRLTTTWKTDTVKPAVQSFTADQQGSTRTPASRAIVILSEALLPSSFSAEGLSLTRSGLPVALTGISITAINEKTFRVNGLAAANDIDGEYVLTVDASNAIDAAGNRGSGTTSISWSLDTIGPAAATGLKFVRDLTSAGSAPPTVGTIVGSVAAGFNVELTDLTTSVTLGNIESTTNDFAIPVDLRTTGTHQLRVRISDAAGNFTDSTLTIFLDPTILLVERIDGIPLTPTASAVDDVEITFSKPVSPATFTSADLELTCDDGPNLIGADVSVQAITDRSFRVSGLAGVTGLQGLYKFIVRTSGLTDLDGIAGSGNYSASWLFPAPTVIDSRPPISAVDSLAVQSDPTFNVRWSGTDDSSGVASFSIYVSVNSGPFSVWLSNTTLTTSVFNGQTGRKYDFYSVAIDTVGNIESIPSTADTGTIAGGPNGIWQNPILPLDVDNDKNVSPLDVLVLINYINSGAPALLPVSLVSPPPYYDVDSDGFVSPLDILIVINFLNRQGGAGEGEVTTAYQIDQVFSHEPSLDASLILPIVSSATDRFFAMDELLMEKELTRSNVKRKPR